MPEGPAGNPELYLVIYLRFYAGNGMTEKITLLPVHRSQLRHST